MKKLMNHIFIVICIMVMIIGICLPVVKANSTYTIKLEVTKNKEQKTFEIYMLLPQNYITYAIHKAGLDVEYEGAETLKKYDIPLISIDKSKIQDKIYNENGIEYVQILLEPNEQGIYTFEIIADYPEMDMKLRVKNDEKDNIMHINNFKVQNNVCEIEYNYDENTIKQPTKIVIDFGTVILIILLIVIIIIAIISKIKTKK